MVSLLILLTVAMVGNAPGPYDLVVGVDTGTVFIWHSVRYPTLEDCNDAEEQVVRDAATLNREVDVSCEPVLQTF